MTSGGIWSKLASGRGARNSTLFGSFFRGVSELTSWEYLRKRKVKIRNIQKEDISQIIELWQKFGEYHRWLDTPESLARRIEEQGDLFLLAETEDEIVGSVMGSYDGRFAFVARLVVVPAYRRKGIATKLMEELERRLREKGAVQGSLLIERDNHSAMSLYEKMGYEFFKDVCYMRKRLS